ncbi:hypothetical protein QYF36_000931 [Acer negundo]|nr:hypothetical protein QYF36_000931 [Acer negundo]
MHAIWGCRSLKSVRDAWPAVVVLGDTKNAWLVDFMIACGHSLSCEDLGLHVCSFLWSWISFRFLSRVPSTMANNGNDAAILESLWVQLVATIVLLFSSKICLNDILYVTLFTFLVSFIFEMDLQIRLISSSPQDGRSDLNRTRGRKKTVRNVFTYRYSS